MDHREFGKSGLQVPVVGMGTWQTFDVHGESAEQNARAIVDTALHTGAILFDSSPMYGQAERVLGQALRDRRNKALIATKIWARSKEEGYRQVERAFQFFDNHVDLYQIHNLALWQ